MTPVLTDLTSPFWDAAARDELRMQRCEGCGHLRFPIAAVCPRCLSPDAEWAQLVGEGEVFASIVYRRSFGGPLADQVPYVVAIVQLDEGPRMISNIVDCEIEEVEVGRRVEVVFDHAAGVTVPRFRLARGPA